MGAQYSTKSAGQHPQISSNFTPVETQSEFNSLSKKNNQIKNPPHTKVHNSAYQDSYTQILLLITGVLCNRINHLKTVNIVEKLDCKLQPDSPAAGFTILLVWTWSQRWPYTKKVFKKKKEKKSTLKSKSRYTFKKLFR